jgi:hypothetical protein
MGRTYEQVVEAAAKALYEHQRSKLVQQIEQRSFDPAEMVDFFLGLRQETDRAIAIIAFSYIEACLSDLLEFELSDNIPGGTKSLLDPDRPLGTVSSKIKLCAGLEWISPSTASDLDLMRKIRNRFAHKHTVIDYGMARPLLGARMALI